MRFTTIWDPTINYRLRERLRLTNEELLRRIAHRLPRRLAYYSFIDSGVRYMARDEVVPEVTYTTLLQRFSHVAEKH